MLAYPDEYRNFAHLIKEHIVLAILIRALQYDLKQFKNSNLKFARAYLTIFTYSLQQAENKLRQVKTKLREIGGQIIEEEQQEGVRVVTAKFRGFIYNHRYMNPLILAECEKMLQALTGLRFNPQEVLKDDIIKEMINE